MASAPAPTRISLTALEKAAGSLERALAEPPSEIARDATIQRFEYTFELAWKVLNRFLAEERGPSVVGDMTKRDLFRLGAKLGFITDPEAWFLYLSARNRTSHTYNERVAEEVFALARGFALDVAALLAACRRVQGVNP